MAQINSGQRPAHIKIHFTMGGHSIEEEWLINWTDNGSGIDSRILEWFRYESSVALEHMEKSAMESNAVKTKLP
jgi:hypothetical protein